MNTSVVRDTKSSHFTFAVQVSSQQMNLIFLFAKTLKLPFSVFSYLQLGLPHTFVMMSYQYKFQDDDQTKIKGSIKYVLK